MIIFAHRGYTMKYPENTMTAFRKAVENGAKAIETDVQMTKDGRLVLTHDENVKRCTGIDTLVKELTFEEIRKLDFSYKSKFKDAKEEKIPELKELLIFCKENNILLNLELKNSEVLYENIELLTKNEVENYGNQDLVIYSSFNHDSVRKMIDLSMNAAPLLDREIPNLAEYLKNMRTRGVHPGLRKLDENTVRAISYLKKENYFINIYTINDVSIAKELDILGVDGIFTDDIKTMTEELKK